MPFPRFWTYYSKGLANRVARHFVGHGNLVELEHVGRKSGKTYHTPLRAFRSAASGEDVVVAGLNFGRESDWFKNVEAAGHARMLIRGRRIDLGPPRVLPLAEGVAAMPRGFGFVIRHVVRTTDCVEWPVLDGPPAG